MFGRKRQIAELNAQADQLLEHARWLQERQAEMQAHIDELHHLLDRASVKDLLLHMDIEDAKRRF